MKKNIFWIILVIFSVYIIGAFAENTDLFQAYRSNATIFVDGVETDFDMPVVLIDDRTYIPLRETSEKLGIGVEWIEGENKILLNKNDEKIIQMSVHPAGSYDETYLLTLYSGGRFEVSYGKSNSNSMLNNNYFTAYDTKSVFLQRSDVESIVACADKITDTDLIPKDWILDGWEIFILYNQVQYEFNLNQYSSEHIEKLVNLLIELSPLQIDLHGWA